LFCFSALTYNSHRVHYDYLYVTQCEGYPRLLVTGPLQVELFLDLARSNDSRSISEFSCRALRPLFEGSAFTVEGVPAADGKSARLWTCDAEGAVCMTAEVKFTNGR
jgi:3-methylfumaryl-CoA hydratase